MIVVLMGVSGCGKSTIGKRLAALPGWTFCDGDDLHPAPNIAKMATGQPLTDRDRAPWLDAIHQRMLLAETEGEDLAVACSALKASYRRQLQRNTRKVQLVYLRVSHEVVAQRLKARTERTEHFFDPALLGSQFATLEEPEHGLTVDADAPLEDVFSAVSRGLGLR